MRGRRWRPSDGYADGIPRPATARGSTANSPTPRSRQHPIEIIEDHGWGLHFCLGNAMKYLWRCQDKGTMLQDLKKARWYIDRAIANLEAK